MPERHEHDPDPAELDELIRARVPANRHLS